MYPCDQFGDPVVGPPGVQHHHIGRKVFIQFSKTVADPSAQRRMTLDGSACIHIQQG